MNPKGKSGVEIQDLPDGSALLYDTDSAIAYPVTETAAAAWKAFDGDRSVEAVVDELEARFDAPRETIQTDVNKLVEDLQSRGLLETPASE
jgi:hypothetical protein